MNRRKILIVDDEKSVRQLIAEFVRLEGHEALQAENAIDAMKIALENEIAAFLLDIDMPGTTGISLCRTIRATTEYKLVPIIFITGSNSDLQEAFAAGCDDLINKPIDRLVLRARLQGHIQRLEYSHQIERTREMLNHYLSRRTREVAEIAAETGTLASPEQREVVILFTDIRGFTALSEEIDPGRLFSLVSAQLAMQVHVVYEYGGYVDKFGGDGLMAIFDDTESMVVQSCLCALKIIANERGNLAEDQRIQQLGVGIHMGRVTIGNIGSPEHLDYSAIGNAVNLAARLCGHATPMSIVVSKAVRDHAVRDYRFDFRGERQVSIRGINDPVTVFTLFSGAP